MPDKFEVTFKQVRKRIGFKSQQTKKYIKYSTMSAV